MLNWFAFMPLLASPQTMILLLLGLIVVAVLLHVLKVENRISLIVILFAIGLACLYLYLGN